MAITRRQFVTRLGALAAAAGIGQVDLAQISQAFAAGSGPWANGAKPKVIWIHGAECTGCSTSLLSLFEDVRGKAIEYGPATGTTTLAALDIAVGGTGDGAVVLSDRRTLNTAGLNVDAVGVPSGEGVYVANIADVLIDFIDLQYHETVMGMGGDLAYQFLKDNMAGSSAPFVLVVEGAIQDSAQGGFWGKTGAAPWCSVGMDGNTGEEAQTDHVVLALADQANCKAIISIGQCASFGGYPACKSPVLTNAAGKREKQTPAYGVADYFKSRVPARTDLAAKVINTPGCPTNPWWFVLTVVAWMVDADSVLGSGTAGPLGILNADGSINPSAVDKDGRLKIVYPYAIHGPNCPNYGDYLAGKRAAHPGEPGCLANLGCKGPATKSLCPRHGWNSQHPQNSQAWDSGVASTNILKTTPNGTRIGGFCISAGHPCMGCTEKGYPDSFVPFVQR